jgi:hypothetical protein
VTESGAAAPAEEMVTHKSARECPMIEPHPRRICGIVRARELVQGKRAEP